MLPVLLLLIVQTGIICGLLLIGRRQSLVYLHRLMHVMENILMKSSELAARLALVEDQLTKVRFEVEALKDAVSDADLPVEAVAALDRLSALVNAIDEISPDTTATGGSLPVN